MDTNAPKSSSVPIRTLRPRPQVLMEEWGTLDRDEIFRKNEEIRVQGQPPLPPVETWCKLKLPYKVPSCPPLPSFEEIEAMVEHPDHRMRANNGLTPIFRLGNTVIKLCTTARILEEAETILYLAEKLPQLRLPNILAAWTDTRQSDGKRIYCFMMDFIEGIQLNAAKLGEQLPPHAQDIVCAKVSAQIRLLRSLPSEGYYGRVHGQGWMDPPPSLQTHREDKLVGPFSTYEQFVSTLCHADERWKASTYQGVEWPPGFESETMEMWSTLAEWEPNEPKFTWVDPKLNNMVVQPVRKEDGTEDWDVVLIDWDCCGWYPAWLQAVQFNSRCFSFIIHPDYTTEAYRKGEICSMMLKEFGSDLDLTKVKKLRQRDWRFF